MATPVTLPIAPRDLAVYPPTNAEVIAVLSATTAPNDVVSQQILTGLTKYFAIRKVLTNDVSYAIGHQELTSNLHG